MRYLQVFFGVLFFLSSCDEKAETQKEESKPTPKLSQIRNYEIQADFSDISDTVADLKKWDRFQKYNRFLEQTYKRTSVIKALDFSKELMDKTKKLGDSLWIYDLNNSAFYARLNLLKTQTMRLYDMRSIKAITPDEVHLQIEKIFENYTMVIEKINAIYAKKYFQNNLEFDESLFDFPKNDSIFYQELPEEKPKPQS